MKRLRNENMELLVTSNESWSRVGMTFSIMRMCRRTAPQGIIKIRDQV